MSTHLFQTWHTQGCTSSISSNSSSGTGSLHLSAAVHNKLFVWRLGVCLAVGCCVLQDAAEAPTAMEEDSSAVQDDGKAAAAASELAARVSGLPEVELYLYLLLLIYLLDKQRHTQVRAQGLLLGAQGWGDTWTAAMQAGLQETGHRPRVFERDMRCSARQQATSKAELSGSSTVRLVTGGAARHATALGSALWASQQGCAEWYAHVSSTTCSRYCNA